LLLRVCGAVKHDNIAAIRHAFLITALCVGLRDACAFITHAPSIRERKSERLVTEPKMLDECSIPRLPALKNKYFCIRHGQSTANVQGIISSLPSVGTKTHGLSEMGKDQARSSAKSIIRQIGGKKELEKLKIYSSDFTRAVQTAEEALNTVWELAQIEEQSKPTVQTDVRLRERFFGEFDGKSTKFYDEVWKFDVDDVHHTNFGVESVNSVVSRIRGLIIDLEEQHDGIECVPILFSSHGDTIRIMETYMANVDVRTFPQYSLNNAEVRPLLQTPDNLMTIPLI